MKRNQRLRIKVGVFFAAAAFACAAVQAASEPMPGLDADHPKPGAPMAAEKLRRLAWGPPATNGLQAACYFEPAKEVYEDGEVVKRWKVFHNSGKEPVLFTVGGGDFRWIVVDEQGRNVPLQQVAHYGALRFVTYRLEPGHAVEIEGSSASLGASTKAGGLADTAILAKPGTTCRARWMLRLAVLPSQRAQPVPQTLTTGEVRFRIVEKGPAARH
jgi:hypothetical protein